MKSHLVNFAKVASKFGRSSYASADITFVSDVVTKDSNNYSQGFSSGFSIAALNIKYADDKVTFVYSDRTFIVSNDDVKLVAYLKGQKIFFSRQDLSCGEEFYAPTKREQKIEQKPVVTPADIREKMEKTDDVKALNTLHHKLKRIIDDQAKETRIVAKCLKNGNQVRVNALVDVRLAKEIISQYPTDEQRLIHDHMELYINSVKDGKRMLRLFIANGGWFFICPVTHEVHPVRSENFYGAEKLPNGYYTEAREKMYWDKFRDEEMSVK